MTNLLENTNLLTAIITPFDKNNRIDFQVYRRLIDSQISDGVKGFVISGTTGEAPTLSHDEKIELFKRTVDFVSGRAKVIVGTGSNNTKETIEFTKEANRINGIDAALIVTPYYNKPDQAGMIAHFSTIADESPLPIVIYNIPGRSISALTVESLLKLADHPNIIAVKQCNSDYDMSELIEHAPKDFLVYTGEDGQSFLNYALGGAGTISVASHFYAKEFADMFSAIDNGDFKKAAEDFRFINPRVKALFSYPSPAPVKAVFKRSGIDVGIPRLPILPLDKAQTDGIMQVLKL
ncbi:4-hydroxy-tetrahydrodipicolinate synthase [Oenococcus oeni]|uniref:4-hydroxy-tetrahydrodipicolinate synthase n=1 Tax=Oenococcus oeni TaxID=1247 RepID=UPI0008F882A9|nr:4-hydroxy-tetrahydrodipicolinate synthase [Oenococcus oeni]OIL20981.1 4-hydroxy-tetrahydrodipicolinate synthase [Oenococcus oeni]OIL25964.1 4-hydroxy-tetrahydrodipicolinate synthase [Oenococcus oeni]OIL42096.1 4-hydroxy-tetrahydrodipicolinate synthase [Oenococcus oeni]